MSDTELAENTDRMENIMNARTNARIPFGRTLTLVVATLVAVGLAHQAAAQVKVVIGPQPKATQPPSHWPADARAAVAAAQRDADKANREAAQLRRDNNTLQRDNDALRRQLAVMERELAALRKSNIDKDRTIRDLELRLARERDRNVQPLAPRTPGFTPATPVRPAPPPPPRR